MAMVIAIVMRERGFDEKEKEIGGKICICLSVYPFVYLSEYLQVLIGNLK